MENPEKSVSEEEREFKIDHGNGAHSIVKGRIVTTHHGVNDEEGNPKISVHVALDKEMPALPAVEVHPGQVE